MEVWNWMPEMRLVRNLSVWKLIRLVTACSQSQLMLRSENLIWKQNVDDEIRRTVRTERLSSQSNIPKSKQKQALLKILRQANCDCEIGKSGKLSRFVVKEILRFFKLRVSDWKIEKDEFQRSHWIRKQTNLYCGPRYGWIRQNYLCSETCVLSTLQA